MADNPTYWRERLVAVESTVGEVVSGNAPANTVRANLTENPAPCTNCTIAELQTALGI